MYDAIVIGAGQAGLSTSYHLQRLGLDHLVLDADALAPGRSTDRANRVLPAWFGRYERTHDLPVLRPVAVDSVTSEGELLVVHAGEWTWTTRALVNATGTWTRTGYAAGCRRRAWSA